MDKLIIENKNRPVKVLLICEGTFPYIKGGVSTWIYQIIKGLPEVNFGVVFLGANYSDYKGLQYEIPDNLVYISADFLFEDINFRKMGNLLDIKGYYADTAKAARAKYDYINELHGQFKAKASSDFPERIKSLDFYLEYVTDAFFLHSKQSWSFIESEYSEFAPDSSFTDYFWTVRNVHAPIWKIAEIAKDIPPCEIVHSPSTGYAGFLSGMLKFNRKTPFVLTEHGIYIRERKIDILNSSISPLKESVLNAQFSAKHLKNIWINFFEGIGRFCYGAADKVISLFDDARSFQVNFGVDENKTAIVPNGVEVKKLSALLSKREERVPQVVALIGRVVQIKDVKTFIKSVKLAVDRIPAMQGWIVGPQDEDPGYAKECRDLVSMLGIEDSCLFLGFRNIYDILPKIGLLTLTSISEAMPLVVLEGFGAGVPAVCTDVGSCRQLIYGGLGEEDLKIGKAGEIVPIANPQVIAGSYAEFLTDGKKWLSAREAAIKRVNKYYSIETMYENYRNMYGEAGKKWRALPSN